jgi:hypothetical protein
MDVILRKWEVFMKRIGRSLWYLFCLIGWHKWKTTSNYQYQTSVRHCKHPWCEAWQVPNESRYRWEYVYKFDRVMSVIFLPVRWGIFIIPIGYLLYMVVRSLG